MRCTDLSTNLRWFHCRNAKADVKAAKQNAAVTHGLFGQMKADLSAAMHSDDCVNPGRTSSQSIAMAAFRKKWIVGPGHGQNQDADFSSNANMSRQLLAVELKAGLADFRASRVQRSSKIQSAQHVADNLHLLHENNRLRRANQHLQQAVRGAHAESETSRLSNPQPNSLQNVSAGCSKASFSVATATVSEAVDSLGTIVEDHGEDKDLDAAFVSLGSHVPPSRPTSDTALPHRQESSLAPSRKGPDSILGYKAGEHKCAWPQMAERMKQDHNPGLHRWRSVSAKELNGKAVDLAFRASQQRGHKQAHRQNAGRERTRSAIETSQNGIKCRDDKPAKNNED